MGIIMHKKLLTLLILSIFFINTLYATKNNENNNRKRQHEENSQNKATTKKRKLTKLETEQQNNYPETLTWEDLIKELPNRNSVYLNFIKDEIKDDTEKTDFLNAFKKLYCKNIPLSQNNNLLVSLAIYFQNLYRKNIDKDMILIDIIFKSFSPTEKGDKHTISSMAQILKKDLQKDQINLINTIINQLIQEVKHSDFLSTVLSYAVNLNKKRWTEEKIRQYINEYNQTYSYKENNIIINNTLMQSEINFTNIYNKLNENNKIFFENLSPDLKNSLKKALHINKDKDENIFLEELNAFYTKCPHLFELNDEYVIAHFKNSTFYTMSDQELNQIATDYIPLFKTKLGDSWQKALTLCRQLSFIKIKFLCKILLSIENINQKTKDKFFAFMRQCIDIDTLENQLNKYITSLEINNNNIVDLDENKEYFLIKNIKNNFPDLIDEDICAIPLQILYNMNPIPLNSSPVTYRDFLKKEGPLLNNLFHLFNRPANLQCVNKALENISLFLLTLMDHSKNRNDSNNAIETLEKLRHLHRKIKDINSINALQDNHLKNLLRNYFQDLSDIFIENIPKLIFYHITNAHIDISDVLSNIFHKQLAYIANPNQYERLTIEEQNKINEILHYFSPCLEIEPDLLKNSQRIKAGNNDIYYTLIDIRRTLNQIITRLNGTEVNYNDRQSLHNKETHKVVDDMIQEMYKIFPLYEYKVNHDRAKRFYNPEGTINNQKTNIAINFKIDFVFDLFIPESDINKFERFLFKALEIPTSDMANFDELLDQFSNNMDILIDKLNSYSKEVKLHDEFSSFLEHYFDELKNNPILTLEEKDISFREIFNKACVHLHETKRFSENNPILSSAEITKYIDSFLCYHAKQLTLKIIRSVKKPHEEFLQPQKGIYTQGLFALLLRAILNIHATTPNENDLEDKFLTLRNNLAYANIEYVDIFVEKQDDNGNIISFKRALAGGQACEYGRSYAILEQFLNVLNVDETTKVDITNFLQIVLELAQQEVEHANTQTNLNTNQRRDLIKENIILKLRNAAQYTQDFWTIIDKPLEKINDFVEGLREHYENEDDEIMIEENNS
jgi:predicted GIY-YIG superfamily endonuclease